MTDRIAAALEAAELRVLSLTEIIEPSQALRGPQRHDEEYAGLKDSIREKGVLEPIIVRPVAGAFEIVAGMQRYTISRETGKKTIPARIVVLTEEEALDVQIIENLHRIKTSRVQYAEQLHRKMVLDPSLSVPRLAARLDVSPKWIYDTLGLLRLSEKASALVEQGRIVVANATALAKLPTHKQDQYLDLAMVQPSGVFVARMAGVARRIKEGKTVSMGWTHVDRLQKVKVVKREIEDGAFRRKIFAVARPKTPADGFRLALEWVLHRDPVSQDGARKKEETLLQLQEKKQRELDKEAQQRRLNEPCNADSNDTA